MCGELPGGCLRVGIFTAPGSGQPLPVCWRPAVRPEHGSHGLERLTVCGEAGADAGGRARGPGMGGLSPCVQIALLQVHAQALSGFGRECSPRDRLLAREECCSCSNCTTGTPIGQEADVGSGQQENMQTVPQADARKNLHNVIRLATDSDRGLEERDGDGRTALHWAAANGYQVCGCLCARALSHTNTHPPCCNYLRATPRRA